jgi:hypothetical protein
VTFFSQRLGCVIAAFAASERCGREGPQKERDRGTDQQVAEVPKKLEPQKLENLDFL